ncbi:MAG: DUF3857 domain-containing protein [Acidobacteriota bacterium]
MRAWPGAPAKRGNGVDFVRRSAGWHLGPSRLAARYFVRAVILFIAILGSHRAAWAPLSARIRIEPGPITISDEERSIVADPENGIEHGIILVEETKLDDTSSTSYIRLTYHVRAKILSNEGRDLANVVIPFNSKTGYLKRWWGRTLLPDGTVLELKESELSEQTIAEIGGREYVALKGALPGVTPGSVIDYGYTIMAIDWKLMRRVPLQHSWPVRLFRYRWVPWKGLTGRYHISRGKLLDLDVAQDRLGYLFTARNIPAVKDERWAPPGDQIRAVATLYYSAPASSRKDYWDTWTAEEEWDIQEFNRHKRDLVETLEKMKIPNDAGLEEKLRTVYDWIQVNIANRSLLMWEERETEDRKKNRKKDRKKRSTARYILENGQGKAWQLDYLFIGLARILGAEANEVMVVNRTIHYWDVGLLTGSQFDSRVVAVRLLGQTLEHAVLVDPGSGLPYGEIPWWYIGTKGMVVKRDGAGELVLWPTEARRNVSSSRAEISFGKGDDQVRVRWWREGKGHHGVLERRALRRVDPEERKKRLSYLCGHSDSLEIQLAEVENLDDPSASLELSCEGQLVGEAPLDSTADYYFRFEGPWIEPYPDFIADEREHPVVLKFRCVDVTTVEVSLPPGFEVGVIPGPVFLNSPYGSYSLSIRAGPTGYRVERNLTMQRLTVPSGEFLGFKGFLDGVRKADATYLHFKPSKEGM